MEVQCNCCNKIFEVDTRKYNSYKKHGWNFYCPDCKNIGRRKRVIIKCSNCGKEIERIISASTSKYGNLFCSKSCAASFNNSHYRLGENNPNFIDGNNKGKVYLTQAFRTYQHKCAMCNLDEECCLHVHHIDGNRLNNDINNLIILCANCHNRVHRGGYQITQEILDNRLKY